MRDLHFFCQGVRHNGQHAAEVGKIRRQFGDHRSAQNCGTDGGKAQDGQVDSSNAAAVRCRPLWTPAQSTVYLTNIILKTAII